MSLRKLWEPAKVLALVANAIAAISITAFFIAAISIASIGGTVRAQPADAGTDRAAQLATVEQPRPFGYVIGDILTQRVLLEDNGTRFDAGRIPKAERVSIWLERRAPRIETQPDGRRWLAVNYQLISSPQSLKLITIPAWDLPAKSEGQTALHIGKWQISVSPLTARQGFSVAGLDGLRPDRPAPIVATAPIVRQIAFWSGAAVLTLAAWLGWSVWRNVRTSRAQPFGRALRDIRRFGDRSPQAWRALHGAFNRVAGRVTQSGTLAQLFDKAPQLTPLRPKIEMFFEQSSELFFGDGPPAAPMSVRKLCTQLRRIEKRHER